MQLEINKADEITVSYFKPPEGPGKKCAFYPSRACNPKKMKMKACANCPYFEGIVIADNPVQQLFNKIIGLAIFLRNVMGLSLGAGPSSSKT